MQRILALIVSVIMAFINLIPGLSNIDKDTISVGEWLSLANTTFGMPFDPEGEILESVDTEDTYYQAVQTAYQWGILEGFENINTASAVKGEFAAVTLVRYARLNSGEADISNEKALKYLEEVSIAVANGIFDLNDEKQFYTGKLTREDAIAAINKAFEIWSNLEVGEKNNVVTADGVIELLDGEGYEVKEDSIVFDEDTGVEEGSTVVLDEGIFNVVEAVEKDGVIVAKTEEGEISDAYEKVDFESALSPDLTFAEVRDGNGNVLKEAVDPETVAEEFSLKDLKDLNVKDLVSWDNIKSLLLKKAKLDFDIGKVNVSAKLKEDGFTVTLGGNIVDGVYASTTYDVSKLDLQTKFKANLLKGKINEAYIIADYDAVSTTSLVGSYAANLVEKATEESANLNFFEKVKEGLFDLKSGSGTRITLYSVDIPISQIPGLVFTIDFGLDISVTGRISVTITSHETKGYEIINNKGRFISDSNVFDRDFTVNGDFAVLLSVDFILKFATKNLMDVAFSAGVGANVVTTVYKDKEKIEVEGLPIDVAVETSSVKEFFDDLTFCANVKLYGVLKASVGQNSLMKKIGLKKTWTILDAKNATFLNLHIEEEGIVDACTRAA